MITLIKRAKLTDVKATLNIKAKINIIILNAITRFKILIIYSLKIALRIIISNKLKFISFANNIPVIINNSII